MRYLIVPVKSGWRRIVGIFLILLFLVYLFCAPKAFQVAGEYAFSFRLLTDIITAVWFWSTLLVLLLMTLGYFSRIIDGISIISMFICWILMNATAIQTKAAVLNHPWFEIAVIAFLPLLVIGMIDYTWGSFLIPTK